MAVRFTVNPDTVVSHIAPDEMVLVQLQTDKIYVLNRTAARVWELVSTDCDRAEIERRLLAEFEVAESELIPQIDALLTSLISERLIHSKHAD